MFDAIWHSVAQLFHRGGWVMYPLLLLSVIAVTLIFERFWFWAVNNWPGRTRRLHQLGRQLHQGKTDAARALVVADRSIYGRMVQQLLDEGASDAVVAEAVDRQRPGMDRFMPFLGAIITGAPMLGILGTVTGIIDSFQVLSTSGPITDPSAIGSGIAEALLSTVAGLVVALVVLFPYNFFRGQIDRSLGRMETLVAAAQQEEVISDK